MRVRIGNIANIFWVETKWFIMWRKCGPAHEFKDDDILRFAHHNVKYYSSYDDAREAEIYIVSYSKNNIANAVYSEVKVI